MQVRVSPRTYRHLALGVLVYNLFVVAWGALVRATGSGAGCGEHWPLCNGEVVPLSASTKTLIEFTHRITSGPIDGPLALLLLVLAFTSFPRGHRARLGAVLFLLSMVFEALFGALLVKLGLVDHNASPLRAVGISIHQVVTFYLFAAIALTVLWSDGLGEIRLRNQGALAAVLGAALLALPLLAITGAIAALGDTLFPAGSLAQGMREDFVPTAHFLLRLRVVHPFMAVGSFLLVGAAAWMASALRPSPRVKDASYAVAVVFLLQLGAGALNLALLAPTWMQLVHLLLADLTWLAVVRLAAVALAEPAPDAQPASAVPA